VTRRTPFAWLEPGDPPDAFPDPEAGLREPNGLLAAGGDLSPERLTAAYRRGIFPWFNAGQPILWWCPDPRAVLVPAEFHVSRSLRRTLRSNRFDISVNQSFGDVIRLCAALRAESGTWLTSDMVMAYERLHALGLAHSVEAWQDDVLAGGIYGVNLGGMFFGESMFSARRDGSKIAMAGLVSIARREAIAMIDCQVMNPHLERLGCRPIPRREFLDILRRISTRPPLARIAAADRQPTRGLSMA